MLLLVLLLLPAVSCELTVNQFQLLRLWSVAAMCRRECKTQDKVKTQDKLMRVFKITRQAKEALGVIFKIIVYSLFND